MSLTQLTNVLTIVVLIVVAGATAVDAGLSYYIKRAGQTGAKVPQQLLTIDQIAKMVVSEAATLDVSGAEKKVQAVQQLLDQAKLEGKSITKDVAKGAVQKAYDETKATQSNDSSKNEEAQPIGFIDNSEADSDD